MNTLRTVFVAIALVAFTACELITGPDGKHMGIVEWVASANAASSMGDAVPARDMPWDSVYLGDRAPVLEVPDTVDAGVPFDVVVRTFGPTTCWKAAGGDVTRTDSTLRVVPYDIDERVTSPHIGCGQAVIRLPRTFSASFPRAGTATVRVTGRKVIGGAGSSMDNYAVTLEATVVVR